MKNTALAILFVTISTGVAVAEDKLSPVGIFESHTDVGETPKQGSTTFDPATGEYKITGGGANMWFGVDAFQFAWKRISGDVTIDADVHFIGTGVNPHRKAALVIRQNLEPGSPYVDIALHGDGMTSLQYRPMASANTAESRFTITGPVHLRLQRKGNEFRAFAGAAGEELKPNGPVTIMLADPLYVGLGVCSHDVNVLETAVFSNVKVETGGH